MKKERLFDKKLKILREEYLQEAEKDKLKNIAALQTALDVIGLDPTVGTIADGANVVISLLSAALAKESDGVKRNLMNAGISAVSMLPFGDVLKVLKLRKLSKPATKLAIKGIRSGKLAARGYKDFTGKNKPEHNTSEYRNYIDEKI
jgi:hypothetical protein